MAPNTDKAPSARKRLPATRLFALLFAGGVAVALIASAVALGASMRDLSMRASDTVEYVKTQSLTYDSFNRASNSKSYLRALENAQQLARNLEANPSFIADDLEQYASEMRLTGIVVLGGEGRVQAQYSSDEITADDLSEALSRERLLDTADHPEKVYVTREYMPDGSYVDLSAACRTDAAGVVVAYYHTDVEFATRYDLSMQSLLDGYDESQAGTIVVEQLGEVVASNDSALVGTNMDDNSTGDMGVLSAIKQQGRMDEVVYVHAGAATYLGTMSRARDSFVYTYMPASMSLGTVLVGDSVALLMYMALVAAYLMVRGRTERAVFQENMRREREYSKQLALSAREAQRANAAKTEFLQRMSHDLRTPLNGIIGMMEVADAYANDSNKQAECRQKVKASSKLLLDLVNEVLDMSKLEDGKIVLEERELNLNELVSDLNVMVERQAAERRISVVNKEVAFPHPTVLTSPLHVKRLLLNVISNAVKYNKEGGAITLICREVAFENGVATCEFVCADTGIGMSEDFQAHLFEPFAQERQAEASQYGGTGLGMSIAKNIAEALGGSISFESKLGEGTTCTVVLPFHVCDKASEADAVDPADTDGDGGSAQDAASLEGMHVLLVEDNDLNREIAEFLLSEHGIAVTTARDGKQALEAFSRSRVGEIDAILMDVMMPVMNGYEATRAIRALPRPDAPCVPVIAMTANAFSDDRARAYESGMNEHLPKPIDPEKLTSVLLRFRQKAR